MATATWKEGLKAGDKVIVSSRHRGDAIADVERVTRHHVILAGDPRKWKRHEYGWVGSDAYADGRLEQATTAAIEKVRAAQRCARLFGARWGVVPAELIALICDLLDEAGSPDRSGPAKGG